jgi:hypothetical protein
MDGRTGVLGHLRTYVKMPESGRWWRPGVGRLVLMVDLQSFGFFSEPNDEHE